MTRIDIEAYLKQAFGAVLNERDVISYTNRETGVALKTKKNRLRFESSESGDLLCSTPVTTDGINHFFLKFWYKEPLIN